MFRVLAIEREYGSGGRAIARRLAEMLGWTLFDRALTGAVARAAHVDAEAVRRYDERSQSWWDRFIRGGLTAMAIYAGVSPADAEFFDSVKVAAMTRDAVVNAAATGNCVIVGRGAQCVLQDRADVFHVFVYGPWRERVLRVRSRVESTRRVADLIRRRDKERGRYIRTNYGCDWRDPHLYHMMISSQIGIDGAASMIIHTMLRADGGSLHAAELPRRRPRSDVA